MKVGGWPARGVSPLGSVLRPVDGLRKQSIADNLVIMIDDRSIHQLVTLLPVARPMCQLQIVEIAWMSTSCDRYDVIDAWGKRVGILQCEVYRFSTDAAHGLGGIYLFLVLFEGSPVGSVFVWSVSLHSVFIASRFSFDLPGGYKKSPAVLQPGSGS